MGVNYFLVAGFSKMTKRSCSLMDQEVNMGIFHEIAKIHQVLFSGATENWFCRPGRVAGLLLWFSIEKSHPAFANAG
jgi:hypothetical protein